ncbi:type II toxin-antitoxin system Phd/YefM family antitoxin [Shewanella sp. VB17]|uniref:type II toxin-antitoxin system Phd/YefM family antitoxin n=1 Tax=Shewanella sp. VB17 TaxID=2739432 RepID=UPI0020B792E1|nr:type II toxin-antitoxin system Phd/YefM family antitoxin [Shewanella sp. VB17]
MNINQRNMMNIETISYLKKNAANLSLEEPMTITQNGVPAYVIESIDDRHRRDEAIALLKMISFAKNDQNKNELMSSSTFKQRLAARKQK